jgi:hypothetical protein
MLCYDFDLKYKYEEKNDLINFYYNIFNLRRYIKINLYNFKVEKKKSLFKKKKNNNDIVEFPLSDNADIDIFAAKYRQILEKYDPVNINTFNDLLQVIDNFASFISFLKESHQLFPMISIDINEEKDVKILEIKDIEIRIENTTIPNPAKSGSFILDMIDGTDNSKYITTYQISRYGESHKYITGEEPNFKTIEDKIKFIKTTDTIMDDIYRFIKECITDMLTFNTDLDYKIISNNLARGKIYVRKY